MYDPDESRKIAEILIAVPLFFFVVIPVLIVMGYLSAEWCAFLLRIVIGVILSH